MKAKNDHKVLSGGESPVVDWPGQGGALSAKPRDYQKASREARPFYMYLGL